MDFFAQQDKARRKTKLLVFYFAAAVVMIIAMIYFAVLLGFFYDGAHHHHYDASSPSFVLWDPRAFLGATLGTLAVIFIASAYKTNELSGGGSSVATLMGGRPVNPKTTDPDERKLLNVVEEMAIASGVPVPQVYVLDREQAINAFAAGHTTGDAAIGVTRGCIQMLSRDQLQGVIGHEFSHILNGDMRLNIRLIGILFGILCLATIGRILLSVRSRDSRGNAVPMLFGVLLLLIGSVGVFFGRLIQAAVSRQREFLADASSVQFTRNPGGLSGALQKIGRYSFGSRLESEHAPDMCHMFFGNGVGESFFGLLATHPPIPDRIRAIDPAWDGTFPPLDKEQIEVVKRAAISELEHAPQTLPNIFGTVLGGAVIASGEDAPPPVIRSRTVLPNLGNPTPLHLKYAEQLRESLPDSVKAAAREPLAAAALIYALLLSDDDHQRAAQIAGIEKRFSPSVSAKAAALFPDVSAAAKHAHLPMVNLALGALRHLTADQFTQFSQTLQWLIESDGRIELFEFVLQKIVLHHLAPQFTGTRPPVAQYYTIKPLVPDGVVILSALANVGSSDAAEIQKAFATGAPYLRAPADVDCALLPREQCGVDRIDGALNRLAQAVPTIKKNLIEACVHAVGADGVMTESEAELLRAVADTLDCPIPPFVQAE
ncbi:MAG: M48 family metallopeptidase [Limisphaerales bacterium]